MVPANAYYSAFWADEMLRVFTHVRDHHDESAVALRYLDLLDTHFGWRENPLQRTKAPARSFGVRRVR